MTDDFIRLILEYRDNRDWMGQQYETFERNVIQEKYLDEHREWVVNHNWGMGDKPHWWMWQMIVQQMPDPFKFLEVGVYRGSIPSLIARISQKLGKQVELYGVSLLAPTNDGTHSYSDSEMGYAADIATIFNAMAPGSPHPYLYVGRSQDEKVLERTKKTAPYDIIFLDAGHTYDDVRSDLDNYRSMVKPGGMLVLDDSAYFRSVPSFRGFESVARAIQDTVEKDSEWVELFGVTHDRVFYRGKLADITTEQPVWNR